MSNQTARHALPFILPGQAQKELFHNEALTLIDVALDAAVEEGAANFPPTDPWIGGCWLTGDAPSGGWSGHAHAIACWTQGGWRFVAPTPGLTVWRKMDGVELRWTGEEWEDRLSVGALRVAGEQVVGAREGAIASPSGGGTVDVEARASIDAIIAALMSHGLIESNG